MKDDNASERALALAQRYLDLLRLAENAPASPVKTFVPAKWRRVLRRDAARLRQGKVEPRYKNLHSELVGESRLLTRTGWARFFVKLAGDVEIDARNGSGRTTDNLMVAPLP